MKSSVSAASRPAPRMRGEILRAVNDHGGARARARDRRFDGSSDSSKIGAQAVAQSAIRPTGPIKIVARILTGREQA